MPMELAGKSMYVSYGTKNNNMSFFQSLKPSIILYQANQLADLQLWDGNFCSISLFDIDKYLAGNAKNVIYFLLRMATFIKQHLLGNRMAKDIS